MAKHKSRGTQFAALPWRLGEGGTRQIMLLTSRETRRWVIPKGWPMKGRKPAEAAAKEAYEEAGLIGHIVGKRPTGNYHYPKRLTKGEALCRVRVFLFRVEHFSPTILQSRNSSVQAVSASKTFPRKFGLSKSTPPPAEKFRCQRTIYWTAAISWKATSPCSISSANLKR